MPPATSPATSITSSTTSDVPHSSASTSSRGSGPPHQQATLGSARMARSASTSSGRPGRTVTRSPTSVGRSSSVIAWIPVTCRRPLDGPERVPQQVARALELKGAQTQAVSQAQVATHLIELPPGGLVLHRAAILLEPWAPLLAGFLRTTVLVEARDGGTRPLRRRLPRHGVQLAHEVIFLGKNSAVLVQVIGRD